MTIEKLHALGFSLIPIAKRGKNPVLANWVECPSPPLENILAHVSRGGNVGVRLGKHSKLNSGGFLAAADCDLKSSDPRHLEELEAALNTLPLDLSLAPIVKSGRGNGSKHVYFKTETPFKVVTFAQSKDRVKISMPSVPPSKKEKEELTPEEITQGIRLRFAWEISLMSAGKQCLTPPSIHSDSGLPYTWEKEFKEENLTKLDSSLLLPKENSKDKKELIHYQDFETVDLSKLNPKMRAAIEEGEDVEDRSAHCFSASLSMLRAGFSPSQVVSVLTEPKYFLGQTGYDHAKTTDRRRAAIWVEKYCLQKAIDEVSGVRDFEREAVLEDLSVEAAKVQADALLTPDFKLPDKTKNGAPKVTLRNILYIFSKVQETNFLGYNEFTRKMVYLDDTPWGGTAGRELTDIDDLNLKVWLAEEHGIEPSTALCYEAQTRAAYRSPFHPVREWLYSQSWDKKPRLKFWLKEAFGATGPEAYLEAVGTKVLAGAVGRILSPGIKFDYVMVLEGLQGIGKSTALRDLASPEWFSDGLGDIHSKDAIDAMTGKWLIELGELSSIKKADTDFLKAFITRQVDKVRMPYERRSKEFPRQCIFIGTTNLNEYLQDETGGRRFWPVAISKVDSKWIADNRAQLWAEALECFEFGEPLYLSRKVEALAQGEQYNRLAKDEWHLAFLEWLDRAPKESFTMREAFEGVFNGLVAFDRTKFSKSDEMRLAKAFRAEGFTRKIVKVESKVFRLWTRS